MFRFIPYLLIFVFATNINAQVKPKLRPSKPLKSKKVPGSTDLSIGLGVTNSVLFLPRNVKERNNAIGYTASMVYGGNKPFRASLEYTRYNSVSVEPTWYNIKASTLELNGHALYRSKEHIYFYLIGGFSYNVFSGYFTGLNDYMNLMARYKKDTEVKTRWLGFNAGVGLEYKIKKIILSASFKMRLGRSDGYNDFNIQDVCYAFGIRYNFRAPSVYRLFKGPRNRYFLNAD